MRSILSRLTCLIAGLLIILLIGGCAGSGGSSAGIEMKNDQLDKMMDLARNLKSVHFEGKMQVADQISANYNGTMVFDKNSQYMYSMELQSGKENSHNNMVLMLYIDGDNCYLKDSFQGKWRSSGSDTTIEKMRDELKLQAKVNEPLYLIKGVKESAAGNGKEVEEKEIGGKKVVVYEFPADLTKVLSSNPYELDLGNIDPSSIKQVKYLLGVGKEDKQLYTYSMEQLIDTQDKGTVKVINTMNFSQHDGSKIELPQELQQLIDKEKKK